MISCIAMLPFSGWSQSVKMGKRANHAAAYNQFKSCCGGSNVLNPFLEYKDDYHIDAMDCFTHALKPVETTFFSMGGGESQNSENRQLLIDLEEMAVNKYTLGLVKSEDELNVADEVDTKTVVLHTNTTLEKIRYLSNKK